jgi:hypothetical protein
LFVRPPYSEEKLGMAPHSNPIAASKQIAVHIDDEHDDGGVAYEDDIAAELELLEGGGV